MRYDQRLKKFSELETRSEKLIQKISAIETEIQKLEEKIDMKFPIENGERKYLALRGEKNEKRD
jgi:predicted  nucleic acid-binding Zn-ribbon protein